MTATTPTTPPIPSIRCYRLTAELLDVMDMPAWDRAAWVQIHPHWRDYLDAYAQVVEYEMGMAALVDAWDLLVRPNRPAQAVEVP